jgi:putative transcriptional regulator
LIGVGKKGSGFKLGNRLKVGRAERGLTQGELAQLAGVTRQTISSIENGEFVPSTLLAFVLAKKLDMPVGELFRLQGDEP